MTPTQIAAETHTGQHGRHCMRCAAALRQCEACGHWYMSTQQRDKHAGKEHR